MTHFISFHQLRIIPLLPSFHGGSDSKESARSAGDLGSIPGLGRSLEKDMATRSIFLPGESHELKSLAGYSPWGHKRVRHNVMTKQQEGQQIQYFIKKKSQNVTK